ncbi:MAG: hypothetical protein KHZ77_03590 [Veillonella sp.]|uniref:hypothetical protein n=1 Tax=Veillonella sp. TaxID=1926307 RepID=UPI0025F0E3BF|nr:hypothetical protein [Veillonella sp.]MBS4913231.1 hypothetical protein [Veillonella sp.]
MARKPNRFGGGANTNFNGLRFERDTSLNDALEEKGYIVTSEHQVLYNGYQIGLSVNKYNFYTVFLEMHGIDYKEYNSKRWLPDECFVNFINRTVYIIEKKYQDKAGSTDVKPANCDFMKKEYEKLCNPINFYVEYIFIFNDWFKNKANEEYRDMLNYIKSVNCKYYFNTIPFEAIGLG